MNCRGHRIPHVHNMSFFYILQIVLHTLHKHPVTLFVYSPLVHILIICNKCFTNTKPPMIHLCLFPVIKTGLFVKMITLKLLKSPSISSIQLCSLQTFNKCFLCFHFMNGIGKIALML